MQNAPHRMSNASPAHFKWGDETDPVVGTCHCLCFMRAWFGRRRRFTMCDATSVDHHFKYPSLLWSCSNARTSIGRHSRKRLLRNEQNRCPGPPPKIQQYREISIAGRDSRRQCQTPGLLLVGRPRRMSRFPRRTSPTRWMRRCGTAPRLG